MKLATGLLTGLLAATAFAGKFEIIGEGAALKAAEFVRVNITVASECHGSALGARQAVDSLTQKTAMTLQKYKTDLPEQISVSPEANMQKLKTAYIDNQQVVICAGPRSASQHMG